MTPKLPSIKDLRRKGYGKEVINKIADITSPSFCKDPWDSVTIPIVKSRGKTGVIHIHRTTLENEDIFDVKLHSCDRIKCSHIICEHGCDVSLKHSTTPDNKKELPNKESVKSRNGSKFSFLKGTRPQKVASVPSLSIKTPLKKNNHSIICNTGVIEGNIDFNGKKENRSTKRKPSCVLYVYSGGRKRKVGFQLQPEIELFLARSLDKIESYTGKISCASKRSLSKRESSENFGSMPICQEKPRKSRRKESNKLSHILPNKALHNISRSSSGISNPYVNSTSSEKPDVLNKEMSNEKRIKEARLKSSMKPSKTPSKKEEENYTTLICIPGSCNCQETKQCIVNMDFKDYNRSSHSKTNNSPVDSINVAYQVPPSQGDICRNFKEAAGDPFSMDSLNLEEKYSSIGHLKQKVNQRNPNDFHDHKNVIVTNYERVSNIDPHWKHVDKSIKKPPQDYCVPNGMLSNVNSNKIPPTHQSFTSSTILQCPIHKHSTDDYQMNNYENGDESHSKRYKSKMNVLTTNKNFPNSQLENPTNTFYMNSHESACKLNHRSMEKKPTSQMHFFEKDTSKQYPVKECCQLNRQPKPSEVEMNFKYPDAFLNKRERSYMPPEQFCWRRDDIFGDEISGDECLCGCICNHMTCRKDSDQPECDERGCCPAECNCEAESLASSICATLSARGGNTQVCNYQSIEESNVFLRNGVTGKKSHFTPSDSHSLKKNCLPNNFPYRLRNKYSCEIIKNSSHSCGPAPFSPVHQMSVDFNKSNCKGSERLRETQDHNHQYHAAHLFLPKIPAPYHPVQGYFTVNPQKPLSKSSKKHDFDAFSPSTQNCNKYVGFVQCETNSPFQLYNNSSCLSFRSMQEEDIEESYKSPKNKNLPRTQFTMTTYNCSYKKNNFFFSPENLKSSTDFVNSDPYFSKKYQQEIPVPNYSYEKLNKTKGNWGKNNQYQREFDCSSSRNSNYLNSSNATEVHIMLSNNCKRENNWCLEEFLDKLLILTIGALYCVQPMSNVREKNNMTDELSSILDLVFNKSNKEFLIQKIELQNNCRRLLKVLWKYGLNDLQVSNIIKMFIVLCSRRSYHSCLNNLIVFSSFREDDKKLGNITFLRTVRALSLKFIPKLLKQKKLKNSIRKRRTNLTEKVPQKLVSSKFEIEYVPDLHKSVKHNLPRFNTRALRARDFGTSFFLRG